MTDSIMKQSRAEIGEIQDAGFSAQGIETSDGLRSGYAKITAVPGVPDGTYTITEQWRDGAADTNASAPPGIVTDATARDFRDRTIGSVTDIVLFWQHRKVDGTIETLIDASSGASGGDIYIGDVNDGTNHVAPCDTLQLQAVGSGITILVSDSGGGNALASFEVPAHDILGDEHGDSVAQDVTTGSMIFGNATPKWDELVIGDTGEVLTVSGGVPSWEVPEAPGAHDILSATHTDAVTAELIEGDLLVVDIDGDLTRLPVGTPGDVLVSGANAPVWFDRTHNLLSVNHPDTVINAATAGSIVIGNNTPKWDELVAGDDGEVLTLDSGLPSWQPAGGGGSGFAQSITKTILSTANLAAGEQALDDADLRGKTIRLEGAWEQGTPTANWGVYTWFSESVLIYTIAAAPGADIELMVNSKMKLIIDKDDGKAKFTWSDTADAEYLYAKIDVFNTVPDFEPT